MIKNVLMKECENGEKLPERLIREELYRILASAIFAQSERLGRFLKFTVEKTLAGDAGTLKEYLIGTEVYDRKPPYRPNMDSIVRSEARRLRVKLREYYQSLGKNDPVWIYYQPGSYIPRFQGQSCRADDSTSRTRTVGDLFAQEIVKRTLEAPPGTRAFEVQIVFEGTVRVVYPDSALSKPVEPLPVQSASKQTQVREVFSMPMRKVR
jgi:hypothetical protein